MSGATTPHSLEQFIQLGRLGDALKRLNDGSDCGIAGIDRDLVASEVSALAGFSADAKRLAERVFGLKDASVEQRLRARIVLAQVRIDAGRAREAHQHLTEIVNDAAAAKAWRLRCWAELWSLTALGDFGSAGEIRGFLRHLRQHVNQLGDPVTSIALHLFVAEAESRRGVIASSVQHVKIARSLLQTFPNCWLEALAAIDALCLCVMSSDQEAATREEKVALRAAYEAGAEKAKLAVISNSGTLAVVAGNLEVAEKQFKAALRLSKVAPRWRPSILDGLCQVDLARRDFEAAHNRLECLADAEADALSYQVLWPRLTQVRLSLAKNQLTEALRQSEDALTDAGLVGDQELIMRLRLLHAEACGRAGDIPAAGRSLQAAALGHKDPSLELLAEYYRVSSQLLVADGDEAAASPGFERGRRILTAIGHTRAASDLPTFAVPEAHVAHPATERSDVTTASAAALFNQAARADLLGDELTALLFRVAAARAVACVATTADGTPQLISARGWNDAEALAAIAVTPPLPRLELGTWRERHWSLIVDVPPTVTARTAFVAVRTLADCSRTVDTSRRQEREKSALWPMDPVEDATHGVFASEVMLDLIRTIRRVAQTPVTILLTGETGTGKDILARLIHEYSPRAGKMFVPFNCTAVPREMLDSQLFGHRRGAFTGAQEQSPGVIRATHGGTLFLDEIGELGLEPQVKLLRFLESNEVHPIGEAHPVQVDVRVVAATNRDIESLVKAGMFRDDLYYRLNVVPLKVPPLRERREEIPIIVDHYLTRFGAEFKKGQLTASSDAMEYLLLHRWPGNVRQLANELRRAAAMAEPDAVITPAHLSPDITAARRTLPSAERDLLPSELIVELDQPLDAATEHLERAMIQHAMSLASGHMERAAQLLGLSRKGLYLKRQRLGLEPGAPVPVAATTGAKAALEDECLPD
jgi:DNA-binding NtrC family response regulator